MMKDSALGLAEHKAEASSPRRWRESNEDAPYDKRSEVVANIPCHATVVFCPESM